ncbi:hypothetical protein [Devosia sp.]|uniref:hypothetical protein n=1 Tax=Devosia sp. TaxID=1871048 RepID=UPI0026302BC1|nr:hypothetical protein [Devosia sp.]
MADFGGQPSEISNRSDGPLFQTVELNWSKPKLWEKGFGAPVDHDEPCLYLLQRDHPSSTRSMRIVYVGLTVSPKTRFLNHPTANRIVGMRGSTFLSYAVVRFTGRNRETREKYTLEQVEHLLIWALWNELENEKKMFTLPGMGVNGGTAWQILNSGYRFQGQMPKEIVYPWMVIKPGRDRSARR